MGRCANSLCPNGFPAAPTPPGRRVRNCAAGTMPTPLPTRSGCETPTTAAVTEPTTLSAGGTNAVGRILGLLGDEWTLLIIQQALLGATRYGEFMERLPISNSVLTKRLRTLTDNGLLVRTTYRTRPVRAEYLITQRGR